MSDKRVWTIKEGEVKVVLVIAIKLYFLKGGITPLILKEGRT
jgi:hypothetical protein